ncbi:toll/interleukin-1 receptor domain-containing protein [Acinetobacter nematophilus]|uniref:Toll/interleukin-1 receptor domain-containing protein n=1 Tax=Acinetobacter nematophilus TaxID=2994642 RepID=A0A9X3DU31_9GAMM|nr:toll/interleukin-1 receptor domain-containing protein [Acinetobacter nematophilus]MCX5468108.1 toll/interleukin-1 receptor domain-containing protein [Acinetobacter nematophilus]
MGEIEHKILPKIKKSFFEKIEELGISRTFFKLIDRSNFEEYTDANPAFCIYFGQQSTTSFLDETLVESLVKDATLLLPVIDKNLSEFNNLVPSKLQNYNGLSLLGLEVDVAVEQIVNNALEAFNLLKSKRRVFVSYKRSDSSGVAIQLYEYLEQHNFDVFLDTHSIRKSEPFQDELWQRMIDSDVVILLSTENYLESEWTQQELTNANLCSIGLVQVVWPEFTVVQGAQLSEVLKLEVSDFISNEFRNVTGKLKENCLMKIVQFTEALRARTLASRQDKLISTFMQYAEKFQVTATLSSHKFIELEKNGEKSIVVPALGIPKALNCEESQTLIKAIYQDQLNQIFILYDEIHIRDIWLRHLNWLNEHLPVKTKEIGKVSEWLAN